MKNLPIEYCAVPIILLTIALILNYPAIASSPNEQNPIENEEKSQGLNPAIALKQRGRQKLQRQDYQGAIADFSQSILLNPDLADSYYYRGLIRAELEDQLGAISDFDDAILKDPHHSWAYYHRAGVFFNLGNRSEGILDLQLAARLFREQGNTVAYQKVEALLNHFGVMISVP